MACFHGYGKSSSYFEGWYFKHQADGKTLAFIPGFHVDEEGRKSAFIQIITEESSWLVHYPISEFRVSGDRLRIQIGRNLFTSSGIRIDIHTPEVCCRGTIRYGAFTPLRYDAMGLFRFLPGMECSHGVISLMHRLHGSLTVNGQHWNVNGGRGYIEKDWGTSFPKRYFWAQSNDFKERRCSIMVSAAEIPFAGKMFHGCIGVVWLKGKEYRLATYNGGYPAAWGPRGCILVRGRYRLDVQVLEQAGQSLMAPVSGAMSRVIQESAACRVRFRFTENGIVLFDEVSPCASAEYVGKLGKSGCKAAQK